MAKGSARFWSFVAEQPNGCWHWTGKISKHGYATTRYGAMNGATMSVHRISYTLVYGPIAENMQIDHLCHQPPCPGGDTCLHRRCVNPDHLEAVTASVNMHRSRNTLASINKAKVACPHGHPYDEANTYLVPGKFSRQCKTCKSRHMRAYNVRLRAEHDVPSPGSAPAPCGAGEST